MDFEQYWTLIGGDVNFADRKKAAAKHGISTKRLHYIFVWFYREAKKRGKYDFFGKIFHFGRNTKVVFDIIFAPVFEKMSCSGF